MCTNPAVTGPATHDLVSIETGAVTHLGSGSCFFTADSAYAWCSYTTSTVPTTSMVTITSTKTGTQTASIAASGTDAVTADGKYIVVGSAAALSAIALDGSSTAPVSIPVKNTNNFTLRALSGSRILVQDGAELRVVDASGQSAPKVLTTVLSLTGGFAVSPDKSQIAYVFSSGSPAADAGDGIYLLSTL